MLLTVLTICTALMCAATFALHGKGLIKWAYLLTIPVAIGYGTVDFMLAQVTGNWSLVLFTCLDIWICITAVYGLHRLKGETHARVQSNSTRRP